MTKKNLLIAIVAIVGMTMFFACSQGNKEKDGNIQPSVKIQAYGKSYTIENYEIGRDEIGTVVTLTGKGCGAMEWINNESINPINCKFIFYGIEFSPKFIAAQKDKKSYSYYFDIWANPDSLAFYPSDNMSSRIAIDCSSTNVTEDVFPLTIQAFGNSCVIEKYAPYKNEKGKLNIIVAGQGINKTVEVKGKHYSPVRCAFISNGQEYETNRFGVSNIDALTSIIYFFDIWAVPETIIFYPADNVDKRIEISCK